MLPPKPRFDTGGFWNTHGEHARHSAIPNQTDFDDLSLLNQQRCVLGADQLTAEKDNWTQVWLSVPGYSKSSRSRG